MKIIFVCMGNTCRSPMAEAILQKKLNDFGITNITASSAGLACNIGDTVAENSKIIIEEKQIFYTHTSFPITKMDIDKEDIIITMERWQSEVLKQFLIEPQLCCIDDFSHEGDIADPYGKDLAEYRKCADKIEVAIDIILEKLDLLNNNIN